MTPQDKEFDELSKSSMKLLNNPCIPDSEKIEATKLILMTAMARSLSRIAAAIESLHPGHGESTGPQ